MHIKTIILSPGSHLQNIGDSNKITVFIIKQSNKIQKIFALQKR